MRKRILITTFLNTGNGCAVHSVVVHPATDEEADHILDNIKKANDETGYLCYVAVRLT